MVARRLVDSSPDVLAVVVLDAAGALVETSGAASEDPELAELARRLVERADAVADDPVAQIEIQTGGGSVFAARDSRHVVACVTRRSALPALVLYDIRQALGEVAPA